MKTKLPYQFICILSVILLLSQVFTSSAQIAQLYPNDHLIQTDPDVVFAEMFEHNSISTMITSTVPNYQTTSVPTHISFDSSVPFGSNGSQSLKLTTLEHSLALNDTSEDAYILKKFSTGISDSVFVRYYVKFNNAHTFHHTGVWIGGKNPALPCWPCFYTGRSAPTGGDSAFVVGTEIRDSATHFAKNFSKFGFYNYWMDMNPLNNGKYYGNGFISPNTASKIDMSAWNCIEIMLKLNNPVSDSTGELKMWINGQLVGHYGKGFPNGTWNQGDFNEGVGNPFYGFRWRSNPAVVFNYIWIKNYATDNNAYPTPNDVLFDHVVVAKKYIGPIYNPQTTGINVLKSSSSSSLYPNPADNIITFSKKIDYLIVFNTLGQNILSDRNVNSISIADFPNGVYLLKTDDTFHRIIVNHWK